MKLLELRKQLKQDPEFVEAMKKLQLKFDLADAMIHARIQCGISQSELAEAIGTKQANISRIESGLGNPTIELIQKIVNYLDLKVNIEPNEPEYFFDFNFSIENQNMASYTNMHEQGKSIADIKFEYEPCTYLAQ